MSVSESYVASANPARKSWQIRPANPIRASRGFVTLRVVLSTLKFLAAVAAVVGVGISATQLVQMNSGAKIDRANHAVQFFLTSKDARDLSEKIANKTKRGHDYTGAVSDAELKQDIQYYLNNLEMIAGNVNKNIYDEKIVFNQLAQTIYKQVSAHLLGQSGRTDAGDWTAEKPLFTNNEFPELRLIYRRWFPDGMYRPTL